MNTVQVVSPAAPQSLLTGLSIVPSLNNTLDPPFAPATYIYTATEVSPFTSEVAVVATHGSGVTGVTVQVGGKTVDAAHVPLNNATDGPGPDKGTLVGVLAMTSTGEESYRVTITRPLKPPLLWTLVPDAGVLSPPFSPRSDLVRF